MAPFLKNIGVRHSDHKKVSIGLTHRASIKKTMKGSAFMYQSEARIKSANQSEDSIYLRNIVTMAAFPNPMTLSRGLVPLSSTRSMLAPLSRRSSTMPGLPW